MRKYKFPFPSNGKAYPKQHRHKVDRRDCWFPFPSNGKAYHKKRRMLWNNLPFYSCFHSLPTGKRITRAWLISISLMRMSFHSLPTGKRITSCYRRLPRSEGVRCFHSLQTGKRITSSDQYQWEWESFSCVSIPFKRESVSQAIWLRICTRVMRSSFHSLQTGKCIASEQFESTLLIR